MREQVYITDVGPRDGLQNETSMVPTSAKIAFVEALVEAGSKQIEVTSFVHPKWVPQMADAHAVFTGLTRQPDVRYLVLVPNMRGYERAREAGCEAIALFTAASEGFNRANINMNVDESLAVFREVATQAHKDGVAVRGYVSTVFECPYDGPVEPAAVDHVVQTLRDIGCYEISLGDTIGVGTPRHVKSLLDVLLKTVPVDQLVMHFHDTWGMGTANVAESLEYGIRRFDSSAGGLGGCPYAKSATGNVPSEDVVYLLDSLGYETGIDLDKVVLATEALAKHLDHALPSRVHQAVAKRLQSASKTS
ncbi:MAG: hydroxymethylglutaryl-CoA lyase [Myxococcota bacterium]|jgi:hydroxymethylglutaryl-CoA lyase